MATGAKTVPVAEPVFAPKAVLTKNPRPAHTRQWPEERARTNLVKADQLKIEYDFETFAPGRRVIYDDHNEYGFWAGRWFRAEEARFRKIISDYSLEVNPEPRWTDYKEMVQELRAEELPEEKIQERIRLLGRDWLQQESDERIERLIADAENNHLHDLSMTDSMLQARIREIRQAETSLVAKTEEEIRKKRLIAPREARAQEAARAAQDRARRARSR